MTNAPLDALLQSMKDALEKLERAIQLPSRKEFQSMADRVSELSRRIDRIERSPRKPRKKPR